MRRTMRIVCILLTTHVDVLSALTPTRLGTIRLTTGRSFARLLRYDGFAARTSQEMRKGILSVCRRQRYGTERNRTERTPTFPLEHGTLKRRKCHCACGRLLRHG